MRYWCFFLRVNGCLILGICFYLFNSFVVFVMFMLVCLVILLCVILEIIVLKFLMNMVILSLFLDNMVDKREYLKFFMV